LAGDQLAVEHDRNVDCFREPCKFGQVRAVLRHLGCARTLQAGCSDRDIHDVVATILHPDVVRRALATVLFVPVLAGCHWSMASLNRSGTDFYRYAEDGTDGMTVTAASSNTQANNHELFWKTAGPTASNEEQCATWTSQTDPNDITQQGIALRIKLNADGVPTTVTVTKNIWLGGYWIFNFHEWVGAKGTLLGSVNLNKTFQVPNTNQAHPLPWRICARTDGATLEFKAWRYGVEREPAYGDPDHWGKTTLHPAFVYAGKAGEYVAHLAASRSARYDGCCFVAQLRRRHPSSHVWLYVVAGLCSLAAIAVVWRRRRSVHAIS
jgi:hypothetical protein